jgi:hypothetical protein
MVAWLLPMVDWLYTMVEQWLLGCYLTQSINQPRKT